MSCSGCGRAPWPPSRCSASSRARRHPTGACSGSTASSESVVAKALADAGGDGDGVEVTICARDFEIHVDLIVEPGAEARATSLEAAFVAPVADYLFGRDERSVQELVLELCRARGLTLGTAESCTGGLVAGRLTSVPGSSDVFRGGLVAYDNDVKEAAARRPGRPDRSARRRLGRGGRCDGPGCPRAARGRRRRLGDRDRRTGRGHAREAGRPRLLPRRRARWARGRSGSSCPATASVIRSRSHGRGAAPRAAPARGLSRPPEHPAGTHPARRRHGPGTPVAIASAVKEVLRPARTYVCITSDGPAYLRGRRPQE